ncbi:probable U3 small nucleolar RNA-associated protein 11 isoform X2 [Neltuma alba]|uniref:probable U3 small nucleolar RNA-associated protein 11 isoform X2 n=1 Tax=Neltuma alba TaxID=207710 RepID=UPI0010A36D7F|nr:probable U3 small nucleolar RNA-associated protein 11 isoform X2 [Prosopis alba]
MSSFKNAIPRRAHKERAQPSSRKKFGLLEKHKDYVVRAKAFHKKEEAIRKVEKLTASLHFVDHQQSGHIYFAEDRQEAKEIKSQIKGRKNFESSDVPDEIKRRTAASYRELEERKNRLSQLERIYNDMVMQKELQKKGRKRKLREDEVVCPTSRPVYKWRSERKR